MRFPFFELFVNAYSSRSVFENTTEKFQLVMSLSCGLVGKIDNKQCLLKAIFCDQLTGMEKGFGVWYGIFYSMETLIEILDQLCWFGGHHGLIRGTVLGCAIPGGEKRFSPLVDPGEIGWLALEETGDGIH